MQFGLAKDLIARQHWLLLNCVKRVLLLTAVFVACMAVQLCPAEAADPSPRPKRLLHGFMAKNKEGEPASKFFSGAQKIYAFWKGDALKAGDRVGIIWIAEHIGYTGQGDKKITEGKVTAYKPDDDGAFSLSRPTEGWPLGNYRVELYVGQTLAETLRFTVEADVTVEVVH
jgi:hypothetical protein